MAAAKFAAEIQTLLGGRLRETQRWANEAHAAAIAELAAGRDTHAVLHGNEEDGGTMLEDDKLRTWFLVPGADATTGDEDTWAEATTPISDLPAAVQAALDDR